MKKKRHIKKGFELNKARVALVIAILLIILNMYTLYTSNDITPRLSGPEARTFSGTAGAIFNFIIVGVIILLLVIVTIIIKKVGLDIESKR